MEYLKIGHLVSGVVFSFLGIVVLGASIFIFDMLTPYKLWDEIVREKNVALAIVLAGTTLAMGIIVASAING